MRRLHVSSERKRTGAGALPARRPIRGRSFSPRRTGALVALGGALLAALSGRDARAQATNDTAPPLPNVMLLLDTSGSMENMIDGTANEKPSNNPMPGLSYGATCTGAQSAPNRWGVAVQALTGDFNTYACVDMPRKVGTPFDTEYTVNGNHPYDLDYYLDFHRPAQPIDSTHVCVIGHNGTTWPPATPVVNTDFNSASLQGYSMATTGAGALTYTTAGTCTFNQSANGALDLAATMIRFGLMTFDSDTSPATGVNVTTASPLGFTNAANPFTGLWSYYNGWDGNTTTSASHGHPAGCTTDPFFEVGARNPAAPPWEGRMIRFADPNTPSQLAVVNQQIQLAINAMRPYGANPIAGLFDDAKYYFWLDPQGPSGATNGDPYVKGGCRTQYIILLTHAAPNEDLQPYCTGTGGKCPYDYAENIAGGLAQGSYTSATGLVPNVQSAAASGVMVKTFVIGFSASTFTKPDGTAAACTDVIQNGTINSAICSSTDPTIKSTYSACCTLEKIAIAGGTTNAYFADSAGDLNNALGSIIGSIIKEVSTRTTPVASPVVTGTVGSTGGSQSAVFYSTFTPSPAVPWSGNVQRQRQSCTFSGGSFQTPTQPITSALGDKFADNMDLDHDATSRAPRRAVQGDRLPNPPAERHDPPVHQRHR
jgi:type IV pilus assembly protein PilY1